MEIQPSWEEEDKVLAGFCYPFWGAVSWILLLTPKRHDPYLKFHAIQSIGFGFFSLVIYGLMWLLFYLITQGMAATPSIASGMVVALGMSLLLFIGLIIFGITLYFAGRAHSGIVFRLPAIGPIAYRMAESEIPTDVEAEA